MMRKSFREGKDTLMRTCNDENVWHMVPGGTLRHLARLTFSEMLVCFLQTTWYHIPQDSNLLILFSSQIQRTDLYNSRTKLSVVVQTIILVHLQS
jgi:hypothetical protein